MASFCSTLEDRDLDEGTESESIYLLLFYINTEGLPFGLKVIDLICLLFMLLEKISALRNQPANNIGSDSKSNKLWLIMENIYTLWTQYEVNIYIMHSPHTFHIRFLYI